MDSKHALNDLSVAQVRNLRRIEDTFRRHCRQFGYDEIKTATIQHQYIFTAREVLSPAEKERMIDFFDKAEGWGGEPVVLRPDSSPCVARSYNERLHRGDARTRRKFCYVENQFVLTDSKEAISERWQCGVENIGQDDAAEAVHGDIEVIFMAYDIVRELLGKNFCLHLSYPAIIKEMVKALLPGQVEELLTAIRNKETQDLKELLGAAPGGEKLLNLLALHGESVEYLASLKDTLNGIGPEQILEDFENFIRICTLLDRLGCSYLIDFSLLGQTDYYTGVRFQMTPGPGSTSGREILAVGGRYDNLIGAMYENIYDSRLSLSETGSIPATGFALYVKNICRELSETASHPEQAVLIYLAEISAEDIALGQELWQKLSGLGFAARIILGPPTGDLSQAAMVLEVDRKRHEDRFHILHSRKIDKSVFLKMIGGA